MKHGAHVSAFEAAFAERVRASYCVSFANGTLTIQAALAALGVESGHRVATTPLTMSATSIAILHAGGVPKFVDVDPRTWLMVAPPLLDENGAGPIRWKGVPVSLYGLHYPTNRWGGYVDDAAQTLRPHSGCAFTSYSLQASKIVSTGEGGVLATNDQALARRAREYGSLGYSMSPNHARIDSATLKSPTFERHHSLGINGRMNDVTAELGLERLATADGLMARRRDAAALYRDAVAGCPWIKPQHVPGGWSHDMWSFAVALEHADLWRPFADAIERHGGTRPFAAWRITYQEPAFRHLAEDGTCPVAEDLQPRIMAFQTNDIESAKRNAHAVDAAIYELNGVPA